MMIISKLNMVILILMALLTTSSAQLHEDVRPGESGSGLISQLRLDFRPASVLSYSDARQLMYSKIYNVNDSVECVYSGYKLYLDPQSSNPIGDLLMNGSPLGINCEHTFPQSKGAGSGNGHSDMHHLYPARARVNEARLNYPFDEIDDRTTDIWFVNDREQTGIPSKDIEAYSELGNQHFEPREAHKGNVARAIFYFYTVYREVADAQFFGEQRKTLCEWHYDDPVDSVEWSRNIMIAEHQDGKRNPFILDCSLAARTYCPDVDYQCTTANQDISNLLTKIYPNPSQDLIALEMNNPEMVHAYRIINGAGEVIVTSVPSWSSDARLTIDISMLGYGVYLLQILDKHTSILGQGRFTILSRT